MFHWLTNPTFSFIACGYVPLDEEIQAGWDSLGSGNDVVGAITCPRCGEMLIPRLGYRALSIGAALSTSMVAESKPLSLISDIKHGDDSSFADDLASLPPQMRPTTEDIPGASYVTYLSPAALRARLEQHVDEHGEEILERDRLRELDPATFYNLWFYSARFSLPLPLPAPEADQKHYCAMVGWDYEIALRGCISAAKVIYSISMGEVSTFGKPEDSNEESKNTLEVFGDYPLLSRFNLQGYYATVWDHEDLSKVLVTLVEACDKHDFRPVVECLLRVNKRRRDKLLGRSANANSVPSSNSNANSSSDAASSALALMPTRSDGNDSSTIWSIHTVEFECYRTALYLAKYQCTSAFHAFFPATLKPCKGYHFWCPIAPVPIFDRLLHEAMKRARAKSNGYIPIHDVSDVALAFRSVFGKCDSFFFSPVTLRSSRRQFRLDEYWCDSLIHLSRASIVNSRMIFFLASSPSCLISYNTVNKRAWSTVFS